jgi:hypothetical protein
MQSMICSKDRCRQQAKKQSNCRRTQRLKNLEEKSQSAKGAWRHQSAQKIVGNITACEGRPAEGESKDTN